MPRKFLTLTALALLALGFLSCGKACGPRSRAPETKTTAPPADAIRLEPHRPEKQTQIEDVRHKESGIEFTVVYTGDGSPSEQESILIFSVPDVENLRIRLTDYRLGESELVKDGKPLVPATAGGFSQGDLNRAVEIEPLGYVRRWRLATVRLKPGFYSPMRHAEADAGVLRARLEILWAGEVEFNATKSKDPVLPKGWDKTLNALVANTQGLSHYALKSAPIRDDIDLNEGGTLPAWHERLALGPWARLRVEEEGLYRINADALAELGLNADPERVRLYYHGRPYPILERPAPEGNATALYFWNEANESPFSRERVYWISTNPELPRAKMTSYAHEGEAARVETATRTAEIERENEFVTTFGEFLSIHDMAWLDQPLTEGKPIELPLAFHDPIPTTGTLKAEIFTYLDAETPPSLGRERPALVVKAGHEEIGRTTLANLQTKRHELRLSASVLQDGATTLTLALENPNPDNPVEDVWFDRLAIEYPSRTSLSEGRLSLYEPSRAENAQSRFTPIGKNNASLDNTIAIVMAPGDGDVPVMHFSPIRTREEAAVETGFYWPNAFGARAEVFDLDVVPVADRLETANPDILTRPNESADYLIVAYEDFIDGIAPLAEFHRQQEREVRIAGIQSVYDQFSYGELTPHAIRRFLAYTLARWERAPSWTLLVGDATADYRNYAKQGIQNYVPSYSFAAQDGEVWASDIWFGMSAGDDVLSDFMIGRLSVNNEKDLKAEVEKILYYAREYPFGPFRARLAHVSDNDLEFIDVQENLTERHTPSAMEARRIYLRELPVEDNWYATDERREWTYEREGRWMKVSGAATNMLFDLFRDGASLVTYFGHGSPNLWADERMWFGGDSPNSDNQYLAGSDRLSLVTNFTCNTGAIDYPLPYPAGVNVTIMEDIMRTPRGGAIACFVPSGPGYSNYHAKLSAELFDALFATGIRQLGGAVALTQARYAAADNPLEFVYMYVLLGDPATELALTRNFRTFSLPRAAYAPGETLRATLIDLGEAEASGDFKTGDYIVQIESENERTLWTSERKAFEDGKIDLALILPDDLPLGPKHLRLYGWNEELRADFAASANFDLKYPEPELTEVAVEKLSLDEAILRAVVKKDEHADYDVQLKAIRLSDGKNFDFRIADEQGDGVQTFTAEIPRRSPERPETYEVRLPRPGPPVSLAEPTTATLRLAIPARDGQPRFAPAISARRLNPTNRRMDIEIGAVAGPQWNGELLEVHLLTAEDEMLTTTGIRFRGNDILASGETRMTTYREDSPLAEAGRLRLLSASRDDATTDAMEIRDEIEVKALPIVDHRLRIEPDSIRTEPENPTEGHTIFVQAEVVNLGNKIGPSTWAELYDGDPDEGGEPVYNHMKTNRVEIPPLAPGRRLPIALRWDPVNNAGEQTFWIGLNERARTQLTREGDLGTTGTVHVRTKADLAYKDFLVRANELDRRLGRFHLLVTVMNNGETDAHNVTVTFFKGEDPRDEEEMVHERLLPVVPAQSEQRIHYEWNYRSPEDLMDSEGQRKVSVQVRLKGSQQRIISGPEVLVHESAQKEKNNHE